MSRILKTNRSNSTDQSSGGVDEDQFISSFEDVPKVNIYSQKDVHDRLTRIKEVINDTNQDWNKRCIALKELRSLVMGGHLRDLPDFQQHLRLLDAGLQTSLKDLRSQVMREACITISYLVREMDGKFEFTLETLLQVLIPLMQNSAKIMATSACTCMKFVIKSVHSPRIISTIVSNLVSKSSVIRKHCYEFISIILNEWTKSELEKQTGLLQEAIKKGLSDADPDARMLSRKCFASFSMNFPGMGYSILTTFDASKQKQLLAELDDPSLFSSVNQKSTTPPQRSRSVAPDVVPVTPKSKNTLDRTPRSILTPKPIRATPVSKYAVTPLPLKNQFTPRTDSKVKPKAGVSHSTPTSRTGSPSRNPLKAAMPPPDVTATPNRVATYGTLRTPQINRKGLTQRKMTSQSQCNSRDVSPTRKEYKYNGFSTLNIRRGSQTLHTSHNSNNLHNTSHNSNNLHNTSYNSNNLHNTSFITLKGVLPTPNPETINEFGRNLEAAISDAWRHKSSWFRSSDDVDAYSETSSVCSESSYRSHSDMTEETIEIMSRLVCGLWTERKEGVIMLQKFFRAGRRFNNLELRKVMDLLLRMFHDPNPKILLPFLDMMCDLLYAHHLEIVDLLPTILSRLFSKAGTDALGNLQEKINKALETIRRTIPDDKQMSAICRHVVEHPQTLSVKSKQTLLTYLLTLSTGLEPAALVNNSDVRATLTKILTWTSEPKYPEIRKLSQSIIFTLSGCCPNQLSTILSFLPKTYQDTARRLLADHGHNNNNNNSRSVTSTPKANRAYNQRMSARSNEVSPIRGSSRKGSFSIVDGSEEVWDGIIKASEELQQLSLLEEFNISLVSSGAAVEGFPSENDQMEDLGNLLEKIKNTEDMMEWTKLINQLATIIKVCNSPEVWEVHFKMAYVLLLEALQDAQNIQRKCLALFVLNEMLDKHSERFQPYAELTIMNLLEMEKEKDRDVIRAADECRTTLSRTFPLDQIMGILNPVCLTATYPMNMAAVKLLTKVFQFAPAESVKELLPSVTTGLVKGFEHNESSMRKASMLCLISLHKHVGDDLMSFLKDLSPNKMKLLNIYIHRSIDEP